MWKYIIYWVLNVTTYGSPPPSTDEFGMKSNNTYAISVVNITREKQIKEFLNKKEALEFYKKAKVISKIKNPYSGKSDIDSLRIDSIYINN